MVWGETAEQRPSRWLAKTGQWWERAFRYAGAERLAVLLVAKSALAATLAWVVSYYGLHAQAPAFAPFSAVTIMYVTVYQSLMQSLRYVAAVALGVAIQAGFALLAGPDLLTFIAVAVITLSLGRSRLLGVQGPQVATAAFFAFSTYSSATSESAGVRHLGQIVLLVLIGCAIGTAVNVTIAPPMRYRRGEYSIRVLAHTLYNLTSEMHPALREGTLEAGTTARWRERAAQASTLIAQARAELDTARENVHYDPRQVLRRKRGRLGFPAYEAVLEALGRTLYQMGSMTRSLDQWREAESDYRYRDFLERYAAFLEAICDVAFTLSVLDEATLPQELGRLDALIVAARQQHREVAEEADSQRLPLADPARPYGVLVIEATRLMEEVQYTSDTLHSEVQM
ncbi:aromatic acid exporter family protein [Streptomyces sp. NPDC060235]|uniref:FUSC family protein n=1 Tax=Streptomyces sp. NPDC060235 TaxID=3347080 RepID=UPI003662B69C